MHMPTLRVLNILKSIADSPKGLTMTKISEITSIPMSTLSPIMKTLCLKNFLELNNNRYTIGFYLYRIGNIYTNNSQALSIIRSYMEDIVEECNEICQLGVYDDGVVSYIEKVEPKQSIKIVSSVGTKIPAYAPSLGKALLSQFNEEYIRRKYDRKMKKFTEFTTTDINDLLYQISKVRTEGYAYELSEVSEDIVCIAVPIVVDSNTIAAISVSVPRYRIDKDLFLKHKNTLLKYRNLIETTLTGMEIKL